MREENLIKVLKKNGNFYEVTVTKDLTTTHKVELSQKFYNVLTGSKVSEIELIIISFEFLLQRESNEAILSEFNLELIESYFPEYPTLIKTYF